MTVAIGDILKINANFELVTGDVYTNGFHFQIYTQNEPNDSLVMDRIAAQIDEWYQILNVDISTDLSYTDITGQNLTQNELLPTKPWPVLVNGADAAQALPMQVAALVFYRTLRPKTRASHYIPGYTEASSNSRGAIDAAAQTVLQNFGNNVSGGVLQLTVEGFFGAYNRPLDRFTQVTSAVVPTFFRTQRRRRVGVGV